MNLPPAIEFLITAMVVCAGIYVALQGALLLLAFVEGLLAWHYAPAVEREIEMAMNEAKKHDALWNAEPNSVESDALLFAMNPELRAITLKNEASLKAMRFAAKSELEAELKSCSDAVKAELEAELKAIDDDEQGATDRAATLLEAETVYAPELLEAKLRSIEYDEDEKAETVYASELLEAKLRSQPRKTS